MQNPSQQMRPWMHDPPPIGTGPNFQLRTGGKKPESRKEAYLLKDGKYLVGVTQKMHPRYEEIIAQIWDELSLDRLTPTGEATKLRARELMAEMH